MIIDNLRYLRYIRNFAETYIGILVEDHIILRTTTILKT
jgi:hypothetical protein